MPSLHVFAAIYGLNYISTVPATTTLTAKIFGRYSVGELSGWIFFSHQVGSALGAAVGRLDLRLHRLVPVGVRLRGADGLPRLGLSLAIKEEPVSQAPTPRPAPSGVPVPAA